MGEKVQREIIRRALDAGVALQSIVNLHEMGINDDDELCVWFDEDYPFSESLDEVVARLSVWVAHLNEAVK